MQKSEMFLIANEHPLGAPVVWPALAKYRKHPCLRLTQAGNLGY